jgi:hypothetical protein
MRSLPDGFRANEMGTGRPIAASQPITHALRGMLELLRGAPGGELAMPPAGGGERQVGR